MYFIYDGIDSENRWPYDLDCGLIIEKIDSIEGEILRATDKYVEKAVRIKKVNKFTGEVVPFSKLEIDIINSWLFKEDYERLEIGLYCYNAIFKRRKSMWSENGFIDLVVRLTPNALSITTIYSITVDKERDIVSIDNSSNISGLKLDTELDIKLLDENATKVTIENLTSGKSTEFKGLYSFDGIYINSKNEYIKSNDPNIYSKFNRIYLNLVEGINEIKISSDGFIGVSIRYQEEFNLEEVWLNE